MALRNDLTNQWSSYLKPITISINNTYTENLDHEVTPAKAHRHKNFFDVLIRKKRRNTRNPVTLPNDFKESKKVIDEYLKSKTSDGKRPSQFVYLVPQGKGYGDKSYDWKVIFSSK